MSSQHLDLEYGIPQALLFGSNTTDIQRLQRLQNWAAKYICRARKHDHATPYLKELHWLPVRERITFKILVYVYKCLNGTAPDYLSSCLSPQRPGRSSLCPASDTTRLMKSNSSLSSFSSLHQVPPFLILLPIPGMHSPSQSENQTLYANSRSVSKIIYIRSNALRSCGPY